MLAMDTARPRPRSSPPPTMPSPVGTAASVRIADNAFVSESAVDAWIRGGLATRTGALLAVADGRRFLLRDAIRVLGRRNGDTDPYGFTGRAEAIRDFIRHGATVSGDSLRLGPALYDIEYGFQAVAQDPGLARAG
jgi:hypothetical protein